MTINKKVVLDFIDHDEYLRERPPYRLTQRSGLAPLGYDTFADIYNHFSKTPGRFMVWSKAEKQYLHSGSPVVHLSEFKFMPSRSDASPTCQNGYDDRRAQPPFPRHRSNRSRSPPRRSLHQTHHPREPKTNHPNKRPNTNHGLPPALIRDLVAITAAQHVRQTMRGSAYFATRQRKRQSKSKHTHESGSHHSSHARDDRRHRTPSHSRSPSHSRYSYAPSVSPPPSEALTKREDHTTDRDADMADATAAGPSVTALTPQDSDIPDDLAAAMHEMDAIGETDPDVPAAASSAS